jgi:single-strand DNA-binding protein
MPVPQITLDGRVVGDVAFKYAESGRPVARFRMVCADRRQDTDGKWVDASTFWITISVFGALAEHVTDSLRDGDMVLVSGALSTAEWVEADGTKRSAPKVIAKSVARSMTFGPVPHSDATGSTAGRGRPPATQPRTQQQVEEDPWASDPRNSFAPAGAGEDPWA